MNMPSRIALLGYGAMGRSVAKLLRAKLKQAHIVAVVRRNRSAVRDELLPADATIVENIEQLQPLQVDLVVECAGHSALRQFGAGVLQAGCDLLVASVGALADSELEQRLRKDAESYGARVLIPSGALGGLDLLAAARIGGVDSVTYIGRKPTAAWRGTRAESLVNLDADASAEVPFFTGTARESALMFPQNANVTAAVAIAGIGFDATRVQLFADPKASGNEHRIQAQGAFGNFELAVRATTLAENPKTSLLAPCSLVRSILNLRESVALA
jgi:aspartate dehydrogenase